MMYTVRDRIYKTAVLYGNPITHQTTKQIEVHAFPGRCNKIIELQYKIRSSEGVIEKEKRASKTYSKQ